MFDNVNGLTPEFAEKLRSLVERSRPLLEQKEGMDGVQRFLREQGTSYIQALWVTHQLLGGVLELNEVQDIMTASRAWAGYPSSANEA